MVVPLEQALQTALRSVGELNVNVRIPLGDGDGSTATILDVLRASVDAVAALSTTPAAVDLLQPNAKNLPSTPPPLVAAPAVDTTPEDANWVLPPANGDFGGAFEVIESETEGAKVALAKPSSPSEGGSGWNGRLLLCAHGYRQPGTPHLHELHPEDAFVSQLVRQGWAVASTSYRRQGKVVVDGLRDVISLRTWALAHLELSEHQRPLCVLEGRSMGGAIAVLAAEGNHGAQGLFDGVIAIGAALLHAVETDGEPCVFTHRPTVPLLFLTNQSELGPIEQYGSRCAEARAIGSAARGEVPEVVPPATWTVWREGHNLVSTQERFAALCGKQRPIPALYSCTAQPFWATWIVVSLGQCIPKPSHSIGSLSWIDHGTFITARSKNVHLPSQPLLPCARAAQMRLGCGILEAPGYSDIGDASTGGGGGRASDPSSGKSLPQVGNLATRRSDIVPSLRCKLVGLSDEFGDLYIDAQPELLSAAGCTVNHKFQLRVVGESAAGWARDVYYVTYPFIVPQGTWIAYDHPDGYLVVAIFGWTQKVAGGAVSQLGDADTTGTSFRITTHN
jgi:hypothetical protein